MQHGAGVGRRKTDARIPSVQRGLYAPAILPILNGFDLDPAKFDHHFRPFLTGSGSQTECDVTYSKQTTAPFLTGARTDIKRPGYRSIFHHISTEHFPIQPRISLQDAIAHIRLVAGSPRMQALVGRP
jgi:hypothetical protein